MIQVSEAVDLQSVANKEISVNIGTINGAATALAELATQDSGKQEEPELF
jgi:hypothetical protein